MKKSDANERNALKAIMDDVLKPFAPEFKKVVEQDDGSILPYPQPNTHTHTLAHLWHSYLLFSQQFQPVSCITAHVRALFEHVKVNNVEATN